MARFEGHDSRTADKFVVRLKQGLRERLKERAQKDNQAMNEAHNTALERYLDQGEAFDELLRIINQAIQPQGGAFVTIHRSYLQDLVRAVIKLDEENEHQGREFMVAALAVLRGEV